jgi:hypothetical protein
MSLTPDFSLNLKQVRAVKFLLILGLILCVTMPLILSVIRKSSDRERFSEYMRSLGKIPSDMSFVNGKYETLTDEGARVTLQADAGRAENYKAEKIYFDHPLLRRYEKTGETVLRAETGEFDRIKGLAILRNDTRLDVVKQGVKVRSEEIVYDFRTGEAMTSAPINAAGENANFKAGSARIDTRSKKAYFENGVRVIFTPE